MKKLLILLSVLAFSVSLFSQTLGDIVYPANGNAPIPNVEIIEIKDGNMVSYSKDGNQYMIRAIAVKQAGEYVNLKAQMEQRGSAEVTNMANADLYNGYNLKHWQYVQEKAKRQKGTGMALTFGGIGVFVIGAAIAVGAGYDETTGEFDNPGQAATGGLFELVGLVSSIVGVPVWISGAVKHNKATEAINHLQKDNKISFNAGLTQNGVGLVVRF